MKRAVEARKAGGEAMKVILTEAVRDLKSGSAAKREKSAKMLCSFAAQNASAGSKDGASMLVDAGAIKPLVAALTSGVDGLSMHCAAALATIAADNDMYQRTIGKAGAIPNLCALLRSGSAKTMLQCAAALSQLSEQLEHQQQIVKGGAITPLVKLLRAGGVADAQAAASITIANVCSNSAEAQNQSASAGAVPLIIAMLNLGGSSQTAAARALASLSAGTDTIRNEITALGGVSSLLPLLSSLSVPAQVQAAAALAELAHDNPDVQAAVAKAGGIGPLLAMLPSRSPQAQANGAHALARLAANHAENQASIAGTSDACAYGTSGLPMLVKLLDVSNGPEVQANAALALTEIVRGNVLNQSAVADIGGTVSCIELLRGEAGATPLERKEAVAEAAATAGGGGASSSRLTVDVCAEAAGALWVLADCHVANKASIADGHGIPSLVSLLSRGSARARDHAANALAAIALDNTANQLSVAGLLVASLVTGEEGAKTTAAALLWRFVLENPLNQHAIARAGTAEELIALLKGSNEETKDFSLWALSLCINEENGAIVLEHGGVPPLITALSSSQADAREQAAAALASLAASQGSLARKAITTEGGIGPLVRILASCGEHEQPRDDSTEGREYAAAALAELALETALEAEAEAEGGAAGSAAGSTVGGVAGGAAGGAAVDDATRDAIVAAGGLPPLIALLRDGGAVGKKFASAALARLSKGQPRTAAAVAELKAIEPLVELLSGSQGDGAQEEGAGALVELADLAENRIAITELGGIGPLVALLGSSNSTARQRAEGALVRLSIESANRVLIIKKLVGMLCDKERAKLATAEQETKMLEQEQQEQEQAAAALANLANDADENRVAIVEAGGVEPLLALLNSASAKARECSVRAIVALTFESEAIQTEVVSRGGIPLIANTLLTSTANAKAMIAAAELCCLAARAIEQLSERSAPNQKAFADTGVVTSLVNMLGALDARLQVVATLNCRPDCHSG